MTLKYWVSHCLNDSPAYSLRGRTKKEVKHLLKTSNVDPEDYSDPRPIAVKYSSGFDLMYQCLGEGGLYEETMDRHNCSINKREDSD